MKEVAEPSVLVEQFWHLWEEEQAILFIWIALKVSHPRRFNEITDLRKAADQPVAEEKCLPSIAELLQKYCDYLNKALTSLAMS